MMRVSEAAFALGVAQRGADPVFTSVGTDTRTLAPGALYVALRGERFDGHDFGTDAQARGASALLVDVRLKKLAIKNAPPPSAANNSHAIAAASR